MKNYTFCLLTLLFWKPLTAQKFMTRTAVIRFFSEAPLENIEAVNRQVLAIYDDNRKELAFRVTMKAFEFEKAAMQEHFNRDYVHSDKYPQSTFEGRIVDPPSFQLSSGQPVKVKVNGQLTLHGITKTVTEWGTMALENGKVKIQAEFNLLLSDYNIKVPSDKVRNISNIIKVFVNGTLDPYASQ
jgi:polyisoprenoid-binding protein YceI